jgi:mannose-6-phosphate isomerase
VTTFSQPLLLDNPLKHYAWGSKDVIPQLLNRPNPNREPVAELWMGAHPHSPSTVALPSGPVGLDKLIAENSVPMLGKPVALRFGNKLPFLWKVLSAAEPLSLQCHPDARQAAAGFAKGVFRDAAAKPEMIVALTPFYALKGFHSPEGIARSFKNLPHPGLERALDALASQKDLRAFLRALFELAPQQKIELVRAIAAAAGGWIDELHARYPGDVTALSPLLFHEVELRPGQALFLEAGELHAYLRGTAIEIMGNSDNVVRAGLTQKHVDVELLLDIGNFQPEKPQVVKPVIGELLHYRAPTDVFELIHKPGPGKAMRHRNAIDLVLSLQDRVSIRSASGTLHLDKGQSAVVPAAAGDYEITGDLWIASVP